MGAGAWGTQLAETLPQESKYYNPGPACSSAQVDWSRPLRIMFAAKRKPIPTPITKAITYMVNLQFLASMEAQSLSQSALVGGQHGKCERLEKLN
jgi:hypothetical protein